MKNILCFILVLLTVNAFSSNGDGTIIVKEANENILSDQKTIKPQKGARRIELNKTNNQLYLSTVAKK